MKTTLNTLLIAAWLVLCTVLDWIGERLALLPELADWSQLGWAFGGSTVYVVWDSIEGKSKRSGGQRFLLVGMCMFLSITFSDSIAKKFELDKRAATVLTALIAYPGLGKLFKKVAVSDSIDDLKP